MAGTQLLRSADSASAASLLTRWSAIVEGPKRIASLLLVNPVEVVELACGDPTWQPDIAAALGEFAPHASPRRNAPSPWSCTGLLESVKRLKSPSWAYRTEVQGLLREACLHVTGGRHGSLEEVRKVLLGLPLPLSPSPLSLGLV
jgi:hypothetical protein